MSGIIGIIAFLTVLGISLVITRVATIALSLTGLSHEAARFQARSAFTGTGFTTREAERVVDHPVRRRIIMMLMVARSAGLVTIIISLILSFMDSEGGGQRLSRLYWLVGGVVVLGLVSRSRGFENFLNRLISMALKRWTRLDARDYVSLLKLSGEYKVSEMIIKEGEWLEGKKLKDCRLADEGLMILGIYRKDGSYVGVPRKDTKLYNGDTLILYGRSGVIRELQGRRNDMTGEMAHRQAVGNQKEQNAIQERKDQLQEEKQKVS